MLWKKTVIFFSSSFQSHSSNEHCRVHGTAIHWQANNSHSPKAIYVAQRPALLALLSEKGGGWTLGGTAVTTELVTLFIKSKDWGLEDLTSCQHGETVRWWADGTKQKDCVTFDWGSKLNTPAQCHVSHSLRYLHQRYLRCQGWRWRSQKLILCCQIHAKIMTGTCLKGMEVATLSADAES